MNGHYIGCVTGLQWMLLKKVYSDGFILHDETSNDPALMEDLEAMQAHFGSRFLAKDGDPVPENHTVHGDTRQDLQMSWAKVS